MCINEASYVQLDWRLAVNQLTFAFSEVRFLDGAHVDWSNLAIRSKQSDRGFGPTTNKSDSSIGRTTALQAVKASSILVSDTALSSSVV